MTPTSVRPAAVMCTGSLDKYPVNESDNPEDQHRGAAATPLPFLLLLRNGRLGLRFRRCRLRAGFAGADGRAAGRAGAFGGAAFMTSIIRVPPPFATPAASSV